MATPSFAKLMAEAEERPLEGWDLSFDGRITALPPWDFTAIVDLHAKSSPDLLDIGTGGGEWLSGLRNRPDRTVAVEGWPPNVEIARRRLAPLGIEVLAVEPAAPNVEQDQASGPSAGALPFPRAAFNLVTSRHEAHVPAEVFRILAPGGVFLTQQVAAGGANAFRALLGKPIRAMPPRRWALEYAVEQLEAAGFSIDDAQDGFETMTFADVGALAWYLTKMPFVDSEFAIEWANADLERLHGRAPGPISVFQPLFRVKARA